MIKSVPLGRVSTTSCPIDRSRRVTRLRITALPTLFETIKPTRVASACSRRATYRSACGVVTRRPVRTAERKSTAATTRFARLSTTETTLTIRLRGELGAALAAASGKDRAAGASAHAETETVNLCATPIVRLESSLTHSCISIRPAMHETTTAPVRSRWPDGRKSTG